MPTVVSAPGFAIESDVVNGVGRVRVDGDLDLRSSPRLIAILRDLAHGPVRRIEVDCDRVEFIDSTGIRALLVGRNEAQGVGTEFTIVNVSPAMRRALDVTGLAPVLAG